MMCHALELLTMFIPAAAATAATAATASDVAAAAAVAGPPYHLCGGTAAACRLLSSVLV